MSSQPSSINWLLLLLDITGSGLQLVLHSRAMLIAVERVFSGVAEHPWKMNLFRAFQIAHKIQGNKELERTPEGGKNFCEHRDYVDYILLLLHINIAAQIFWSSIYHIIYRQLIQQ